MKKIRHTFLLILGILLILTNLFCYGEVRANADNDIINTAYAKLDHSITLYVGSTQALVNNNPIPVDTTVSSTKPFIRNSRTLVPIRFVSEKLGANVQWDSKKQTVSMKLNETSINLLIDSPVIDVNNTKITLDIAPLILNGRTFVPLRAVSEAFGNHVFYDKKLIVISSDPIFNISHDTHLLEEIRSWFKQGSFPKYTNKKLKSLQEIAELEESVVIIIGYDKSGQPLRQGSGFAVAPGLFATNLHVLQGCDSYKIIDSSGNEHTAEGAVAYSQPLDLALLKSLEFSRPQLPIGHINDITKGESIITISSPQGLTNTLSQGIISNIHTVKGVSLIQISADIAPGSSGGALFNMYGEVIGVISFGYENSELNFAIPSEYLNYWLTEFQGKDLNSIPIITLPEVVDDDQDGYDHVPADAIQLKSTYETMLNFEPVDVAFHPEKPLVYAADKGNQALYEINYETNDISKMTLSYMPESLIFANGELYVALAHQPHSHTWYEKDQTGTIIIVDPETFTIADKLNVNIDPFDIAVDKQGYIYVSSGSGQWTSIHSYSRTTKLLVSKTNVRQKSYIEINQVENKLYVMRIETSQREMGHYPLLNGEIQKYEKFQGNFAITSKLVAGPDGAFMFNSDGNIFDSSLKYIGKLGFRFVDMSFNPNNNDMYTIPYKDIIYVYDYANFTQKRTLKINKDAKRLFIKKDSLLALEFKDNRYYFSVYKN